MPDLERRSRHATAAGASGQKRTQAGVPLGLRSPSRASLARNHREKKLLEPIGGVFLPKVSRQKTITDAERLPQRSR